LTIVVECCIAAFVSLDDSGYQVCHLVKGPMLASDW